MATGQEQSVAQVVQQAAEAIRQAASQAQAETTRQTIDSSRTAGSQEVGAEREAETGTDDFFKNSSQRNALYGALLGSNDKRTYDEYQHESLSQVRENRQIVERMAQLSVDHDNAVRNVSLQALQNAVETANVVGKQTIAHRDIAIDREWNVDEVAQAVAKTAVFSDAIAAAVAAGFAAAMKEK